jgi:hypothetical protein
MARRIRNTPMNFKSMAQVDVPQGRNGKHKAIVTRILSDLDQVGMGVALKVPLAQLAESKENVRSALNRATRKNGRNVATASDRTFLYVWTETPEPARKYSSVSGIERGQHDPDLNRMGRLAPRAGACLRPTCWLMDLAAAPRHRSRRNPNSHWLSV